MSNPHNIPSYNQRGDNQLNWGSQSEIRTPRVDMYESKERYYLRLSIPGVRREDLYVSFIQSNLLEIKGTVNSYLPDGIEHKITEEIFKGPFKRMVKFPEQVDQEKLEFGYNNGILEIILKKI